MSWSSRTEKHLQPLSKIEVDKSWLQLLPSGSRVISTQAHGGSYWTRTARIDVRLPNGESKAYFLKLASCRNGLDMVKGEFESMKALSSLCPDFSPGPVGYGTYEGEPAMHFYMCDFIPMANRMPDVKEFCKELADMHRRSIDSPSNGLFGFHVTTYNGKLPQDNAWDKSWEMFFLRGLKRMFDLEEAAQGPSEEITDLLPGLYEKVVPRLLRPLETNGNVLKPCLVHGDLSEHNAAVHSLTGKALIFDASAFWAHNEYDLHMWRPSRFKMGDAYVKEYLKHFPPSAPTEDWDDRNLLYSIRADLHDSALYSSTTTFRKLILATMRHLVSKYLNGYEGAVTDPSKL